VIDDAAAFRAAVAVAAREAEAGSLVTFGVRPTRPETGYGYIKAGAAARHGGCAVGRFVEKPDRATAEAFLADGGYYWNSGMFVFRASVFLDELARHAPAMLKACAAALEAARRDLDFLRIDSAAFAASPADSIDYAVMEKTSRAAMVPLDAGWSDLGSWDALWQISSRDSADNALAGKALVEGGAGNYVHAGSRLVGLSGVSDLVVVETSDAVLVTDRAGAQDLKRLVGRLTENGHPEATLHRKVHRPWGSYDALQEGARYKVKHLVVKPGEGLSVQLHHRRAEHWVVVAGTARVLIGTEMHDISENESIYIPRETRHSLENPGEVPLELIEVQTGDYLGEDDIVRFEDRYGRA
ncbi:MAG: mannose-1-phosphate guanylyltransferase/mannose-6-phosphate isomerase, partial [Betaproteobacteria bacterium]|nr:mannose-1-phosphate guanylyltransferase/mannose-6-phosphate isomerase [Betaproteobacteria bacterium]